MIQVHLSMVPSRARREAYEITADVVFSDRETRRLVRVLDAETLRSDQGLTYALKAFECTLKDAFEEEDRKRAVDDVGVLLRDALAETVRLEAEGRNG